MAPLSYYKFLKWRKAVPIETYRKTVEDACEWWFQRHFDTEKDMDRFSMAQLAFIFLNREYFDEETLSSCEDPSRWKEKNPVLLNSGMHVSTWNKEDATEGPRESKPIRFDPDALVERMLKEAEIMENKRNLLKPRHLEPSMSVRPVTWERFLEWSKGEYYEIFLESYHEAIWNWWNSCEMALLCDEDISFSKITFLFLNRKFVDKESLRKWTTEDSPPSDWKWNAVDNPFFRDGEYHLHVQECSLNDECLCDVEATLIDPNFFLDISD